MKKIIDLVLILGVMYIVVNMVGFLASLMENNVLVFVTMVLIAYKLMRAEILD